MNKSTVLNLIISSLLILSIGLFTGFSVGYGQAQKYNFAALKQTRDINPGISTLKLLKEENGTIYGQTEGQKLRIAYGPEKIFDLKPGEKIEIPMNEINLASYYGAKDIPEGIAYISSKTGKYFYSVLDPRALRILAKNRLYFSTEEQAYEEGFIPPK